MSDNSNPEPQVEVMGDELNAAEIAGIQAEESENGYLSFDGILVKDVDGEPIHIDDIADDLFVTVINGLVGVCVKNDQGKLIALFSPDAAANLAVNLAKASSVGIACCIEKARESGDIEVAKLVKEVFAKEGGCCNAERKVDGSQI